FSTQGGSTLNPEQMIYGGEPIDGYYYITVDPAGFSVEDASSSKYASHDETAIAVVKASPECWYVKDIIHGRWDTRETAVKILRAGQLYKPVAIGIEKGSLKNALMPYLQDMMLRIGTFPNIVEVTHGGKKKIERIVWALQGRLEHGRLRFPKDAPFVEALQDQMSDFPNPLAHDDLLDALAYIDQIAHTVYNTDVIEIENKSRHEPLDLVSGY
ncbi:MAG: hypothetical protein NWE76_08780, partial [Candidatus Bathyarchaeota archaeon]|nr:hypothetical protein [Candidatus Bathyarchaeota archaeon]